MSEHVPDKPVAHFTPGVAKPVAHYSHAVTAGGFAFVAGQVGFGPDGKLVGIGDVQAQTRQMINNIRLSLEDVGLTLRNVVTTTVYLKNPEDYAAYEEVYKEMFGEWTPARATIIADLVRPDFLIEIQAVAAFS
ncbi:MAG: RidA family protein [Gammaproteobacteria bacterium]|nr:RidA family protein [Gammaproteobacteria bacterium]